jgi:hypothetical protein
MKELWYRVSPLLLWLAVVELCIYFMAVTKK